MPATLEQAMRFQNPNLPAGTKGVDGPKAFPGFDAGPEPVRFSKLDPETRRRIKADFFDNFVEEVMAAAEDGGHSPECRDRLMSLVLPLPERWKAFWKAEVGLLD